MSLSFEKMKVTFTPHARGSTPGSIVINSSGTVYPACAGIDLLNPLFCIIHSGLPRMRGDRPTPAQLLNKNLTFTPHARGSTYR